MSPDAPPVRALIEASHALMCALFPADENHMLDLDALAGPDVRLWGAEAEAEVLGCVALQRHAGYGEVKSLFVAPEARGLGLGRKLLLHVEAVAREEGFSLLRLETGNKLAAAGALYAQSGYRQRGPFGGYAANGSSVFYEKPLGGGARISG
ncbi:putative N-acetyltransferase YsnE [Roseivivax jejudonensis]|uniref:Putative N-acetyltransferase YsnE n=1 Tax=Roseivivax jejudonensis TaxID=1529041 RepID=A0A1X6YE93_9RHOB|nr:GNAT family N-acetyltransferase [Roseivivax jejudonensis]SLN17949.1 putative N-acetyltransferase YsnE [Roseivivax jejudonensis]